MEYSNKKVKKIIYFFILIFIIFLIATIISLLILKYEVEGENNMPFELSQIIVVSTAEGISRESEDELNFNIVQNNDIYIHIGKNKGYRETEVIKNIIIDNFVFNTVPKKGETKIYRPSNNNEKAFEYNEAYIVKDSLIFKGEENTDLRNLKIANQGGVVAFRYSNQDLRRIFSKRNKA